MKLLEYKYLALDFDGIFTDNKVYCDSNGNEFVRCCKYDSMALSIFKKYIDMKNKCFQLIKVIELIQSANGDPKFAFVGAICRWPGPDIVVFAKNV